MGHFFEGMIYDISLFSITRYMNRVCFKVSGGTSVPKLPPSYPPPPRHKTFVTTAHPPTAKGGDCGISAFSALLYAAHTGGKLGGQNFALWSHRRNRKLPLSKGPNA